jgi:hypothetical protein
MCLDEVFHHRLEARVATFILRVHHHAQHVKDVSAFGVDQEPRGAAGLCIVETR